MSRGQLMGLVMPDVVGWWQIRSWRDRAPMVGRRPKKSSSRIKGWLARLV